jgi:demethylspheroidene O-methyltransferase
VDQVLPETDKSFLVLFFKKELLPFRLGALLANPSFRRWAVAFPLTRPIARRRARALFDLCAGFVYSQVLYACVQLKLFDLLAAGAQSRGALADAMGLSPEAAERLLAAAASLRLVTCRADRFALGPLGAAIVGDCAVSAMVAHHAILYADLNDPVSLLRNGGGKTGLAEYWAYAQAGVPAGLEQGRVAPYSALMAASQPMIADEILRAYSLKRHRRLLDVGGGDGAFAVAAAARNPGLDITVFDLPAVAERANARFQAAGLAGRVHGVGGDFLAGLPGGTDVASLVRVIHDHDDDVALAILRNVHGALVPGGTLLLAEPMAGTPGAEAVGDAYFGFYLLAMGSGRPRSPATLMRLLTAAGFRRATLVSTAMPMLTRLIVAAA